MTRTFLQASLLATALTLPVAATAVPLTIVPPDELTLDGTPVATGTFNLTEVIGYSGGDTGDASIVVTTLLASSDPPISKPATIGDTAVKDLSLDIPVEIELLKLTGFFEPITAVPPSPDFSPGLMAAFEIIVGVLTLDNGSTVPATVDNFTYYLPLLTSAMFPQVTDTGMDADRGSLGDNSDTFFAAGTTFVITVEDPGPGVKLDNGVDNPWWVVPSAPSLFAFMPPPPGSPFPNCPPPTIVTTQIHGSTTTRLIPGPCDPPSTVVAPRPELLVTAGLALVAWAGLRRRRLDPRRVR